MDSGARAAAGLMGSDNSVLLAAILTLKRLVIVTVDNVAGGLKEMI